MTAKEAYDRLMTICTPVKRIKAKCLDCSAYQYTEVRECPVKDCPLYPYRLGHKPKKK